MRAGIPPGRQACALAYQQARKLNPRRWSGATRNWTPIASVTLNDLTPARIIRDLALDRPIFAATAAFGHFGRDEPGFTWERTPRVEQLRAALDFERIR